MTSDFEELLDQQDIYHPEIDYVRELLAVLHSDGGHHTAEHGLNKSAYDALKNYFSVIKQRDRELTNLEQRWHEWTEDVSQPRHWREVRAICLQELRDARTRLKS